MKDGVDGVAIQRGCDEWEVSQRTGDDYNLLELLLGHNWTVKGATARQRDDLSPRIQEFLSQPATHQARGPGDEDYPTAPVLSANGGSPFVKLADSIGS